jgi:hypothetical protein
MISKLKHNSPNKSTGLKTTLAAEAYPVEDE